MKSYYQRVHQNLYISFWIMNKVFNASLNCVPPIVVTFGLCIMFPLPPYICRVSAIVGVIILYSTSPRLFHSLKNSSHRATAAASFELVDQLMKQRQLILCQPEEMVYRGVVYGIACRILWSPRWNSGRSFLFLLMLALLNEIRRLNGENDWLHDRICSADDGLR